MAIETRRVEYRDRDAALEGVVASDEHAATNRPAVLVVHGIEGPGETQRDFARQLAEDGYAAFAVDLFGTSSAAGDAQRCQQLMSEFLHDRAALQNRLLRVLDVARTLPEVDPTRIGAVGFCFGGLCVLDLARAGADLRGAASFHGLLTPPADVVALARELTEAGADWQICAYGGAMHAFMAPSANDPESGIAHDHVTARRAWGTLTTFLAEALT